jgi:hypothetical protein
MIQRTSASGTVSRKVILDTEWHAVWQTIEESILRLAQPIL